MWCNTIIYKKCFNSYQQVAVCEVYFNAAWKIAFSVLFFLFIDCLLIYLTRESFITTITHRTTRQDLRDMRGIKLDYLK